MTPRSLPDSCRRSAPQAQSRHACNHAVPAPPATPTRRISIYQGNVELKNLQLKPDALAELDLPICVKAGLLGSLTLKVRGAVHMLAG